MVYEHIVKAEEYLGRELKPEEVVHHEDENKRNNSRENLFVFASNEDHIRYHHTGVKIQNDDGSWYSPALVINCPSCNKEFYPSGTAIKTCSTECASKLQQTVERPSQEDLQTLLRTGSFVSVGKIFGVSDNAIRKWCRAYGISDKAKDYK